MKTKPENEFKKRLRAYILAGGEPKAFALDAGMHHGTASKMLGGMGIRKIFITDEEHQYIIVRRLGGGV
jgi:hypothetical protein